MNLARIIQFVKGEPRLKLSPFRSLRTSVATNSSVSFSMWIEAVLEGLGREVL